MGGGVKRKGLVAVSSPQVSIRLHLLWAGRQGRNTDIMEAEKRVQSPCGLMANCILV